ncbi:MAG: tetratricopeptide repeat protein [Anaerolineae bacterium]|nr:tetratricopeptide repeat protein [Anaerolineae bacterium]
MSQAVALAKDADLKQTFVGEMAWQAWLWLKQGNLPAAVEWAQGIQPTSYDSLNPALEFEHITLARIWIAQGHLGEAQDLLTKLFSAANGARRRGRVIEICILQALAAQMQGNTDQALKVLANALSLGEQEGYVRMFVDEGQPMLALLRKAKADGIAVDYATSLLKVFEHTTPSRPIVPSEQYLAAQLEPLSEREREVLQLIVEGASNREIAQALVVSIGTVKKHVNNIFLKLDAHSRTQVIATARKYHLL